MDLFKKLEINPGPLGKHMKFEGYYLFPKLEGKLGPRMVFRGKKILNWSLNDYLGLANHPEVKKIDIEAVKEFGLSYPMGSRMMSGNSNLIEEFESRLSSFSRKEDTFVLNYGYQGIMSVIDALVTRYDAIVYDSNCHACIIDAIKMHKGFRFVFPHNDIEKCEQQLEKAKDSTSKTQGGVLVITEGVFGMLGGLGNLPKIVELKKKYDFKLIIDDAHGFGTMGENGVGTAEHYRVQDEVDLYFSTFAKALASIGGFVSGPKKVIQYLRYNVRSQIYAKTLPSAIVKSNITRLELLKTSTQYRKKLWEIAKALQAGLVSKKFNIGNTLSPVTPILLQGNTMEAMNITMDLRENYHIFCSIIVYPVVPKGTIMLRLIPTASHTMEDVEETIKAFESISKKLNKGIYKEQTTEINQFNHNIK